MTDCDLLHDVWAWYPSGTACCKTIGHLTCTADNQHIRTLTLAEPLFNGGHFPTEIGLLTSLESLQVRYTNFNGSIPTELGKLQKLTMLTFTDSNFSGKLPTELGKLTSLKSLVMTNLGQSFTSVIPTELGQLSNLDTLGLERNMLTGTIPSELGKLNKLTNLSLASNRLSGDIPKEITNIKTLEALYLSNNALSGPIPAGIENWEKIRAIFISDNKLQGPIPSEIGQLTTLERLDLGNNNLSGDVPSSLENLIRLVYKNLAGNKLNSVDLVQQGNQEGAEKMFQIVSKVLFSLGALLLGSFVGFVLYVEGYQHGDGISIRRISTSFNITLFLMSFCVLAMLAIQMAGNAKDANSNNSATSSIQFLLIATTELSYVKYSYARSTHVLEAVLPQVHPYMDKFVLLSPLILYAQVIPPIMYTSGYQANVLNFMDEQAVTALDVAFVLLPIIAGCCIVLIDAVHLVTFTIYIRMNTRMSRGDKVDERFLIISRFGTLASTLCIATILIGALIQIKAQDMFWVRGRPLIGIGMILAVISTLFGMKLSLYWNSQREQKRVNQSYLKAKAIAQGSHAAVKLDMTETQPETADKGWKGIFKSSRAGSVANNSTLA
ncbi:hypothetical protein BDR26DRAFT_990993 [Obelidium mucronatum]|nr:hypothetical protein BDR26DRAFT_990993 [Obelidium mucronatum]